MSNDQDINEKRLKRMKFRILQLEKENLMTHAKLDGDMVETIRRMITDEASKNY